MLQRFRESLSLILIAVLPMHAMLVTVATHFLEGQYHAPLLVLALWKEVLLGFLLIIAVVEIVRMKEPELQNAAWSLDILDWCIVLAITLGAVVSLTGDAGSSLNLPLSTADKRFLLGFKYDFLPLVAFFVLRRVPWSRNFLVIVVRTIVMVAVVACAYGIATLFIPFSFFTAIGYSDLHSLYRPGSAIASFQFLEGTDIRRIQSFMSGPNQFGVWLLLPLSATLQLLLKSVRERRYIESGFFLVALILIGITLFLTYSRSSWIGALMIVIVFGGLALRHVITRSLHRSLILLGIGLCVGTCILLGVYFSPQILVRTQSLRGHFEKPIAALQTMREHPFGLGLGTAGPASNRLSDTCVFLDLGADITWARSHPDLCVFLGGIRKLPAGKACECPLLTENWYLQWGVEMGYAGLLLSVILACLVLSLGRKKQQNGHWILLAFLGVSIAALFLHAWEDAAVAYTMWLLLSSDKS